MSSLADLNKLKVVDLRAELSSRGLDVKGNKPALVKRLKDALDAEEKQDQPDTSVNESISEESPQEEEEEVEVPETPSKPQHTEPPEETTPDSVSPKSTTPAKMEVDDTPEPAKKSPEKPNKPEPTSNEEQVTEENGDHTEVQEQGEVKSRQSRWSTKSEENQELQEEDESENQEDNKDEPADNVEQKEQPKGEKRKRSSPSPERPAQRRRSKSPIKEDEPPIDNSKVQLNWYDSDLHLQLDKETFLSAKPLHEGAFGYAWAGVRATHGISSGKVYYEVKITEEIKWEDNVKPFEKRKDQYRTDHRKSLGKKDDKKEKNDKKGKSADKPENGEAKVEEPVEKMDESAPEQTEDASAKEEEKKTEEEPETKSETPAVEAEVKDADEAEKAKEPEEAREPEEVKEPEEAKEGEGNNETEEKSKEEAKESEEKAEPIPTHFFRVGWSLGTTSLQLGESKFSYAFESSGKFVTDSQFEDYAVKYGVGDVIGAFLSIDDETVTITYTVNGEVQPNAASIPKSEFPEDFVIFPHVLSRNYAFELNLGNNEESWFPIPVDLQDYLTLDKIENKIAGPVRPENRSDCEVILMCGLPGSGKTHWVKEHTKANPDKKFTVLGNAQLLEKMTVSGTPLKSKYKGRWSILMDKLQKCLNKLIETAALRRRNYIIDQTNVFPSAQRRKLRQFEGFKRTAVVILVPDEEQAKRQSLQEAQDGKDVPESTIFEMKATMSLPQKGEWIEEVLYPELDEAQAKEIIQKYNTQGREAGYGPGGHKKIGRRDDRWYNRRHDHRGKNFRDRNYQNNRFDNRIQQRHSGNWNQQRSGGWNRDRRDRASIGGGSRDWHRGGSGRPHDRPSRESHGGGRNQVYARPQSGGRNQGWSNNWGSGGGQGGGWNTQTFGHHAWGNQQQQGGWSNQSNQNQWKYGGGQNQGQGYGYNNYYYGQYGQQNWNAQGQQQAATGSGNSGQYSQGYTQQAWAQYAQQYAQQGQHSTSGSNQSALQK